MQIIIEIWLGFRIRVLSGIVYSFSYGNDPEEVMSFSGKIKKDVEG